MRFLKAFILIRRRKADANSNIRDFCSERDLLGSRTRVQLAASHPKTIYFPTTTMSTLTQSNMLQQISLTFSRMRRGSFMKTKTRRHLRLESPPPEGNRSNSSWSRTNNVKSREKTVCGLWRSKMGRWRFQSFVFISLTTA